MILHEKFQLNKMLNPKIWDIKTNQMRDDVRQKFIDIVQTFADNLDIDLDIVDIQVVGSNASFNYTPESDVDLHIIANFDNVSEEADLLKLVYDFYKSNFNNDHEIKIHGVPVELYVQDVNSGVTSNGIYSVRDNEWIKFPEPITDVPEYELDDDIRYWEDRANDAIASRDLDEIQEVIDTIYLIRRNSIAAGGEYSVGNQLFKELRERDFLANLKQAKKDLETEQLTLENLKR